MPTKKKRVGFIPREDVMKIIDKLSFEKNLSNSKIISILVEEALSNRGIYNLKTGKEIVKNEIGKEIFKKENLKNKFDKKLIQKADKDNNNFFSNDIHKDHNNPDTFDFVTYEKFLLFLKFKEMIDNYGI